LLVAYGLSLNVADAYSRDNWVLRVRPGEWLVKFRSLHNRRLPEKSPTVLALAPSEVADVGVASDLEAIDTNRNRPVRGRFTFLQFTLRKGTESAHVAAALQAEAAHRRPRPGWSAHFPVRSP